MAFDLTRRHFFFGSLLAGAIPIGGFGSVPSLRTLGYKSPNEKLNIASIGAGGKAASDIHGCSAENIVALCDVDDERASRMFKVYEKVPKYKDFRKMLDEQANSIDAVIVTIPDFMHATAAMWCMERGKHVYVQKPLTRTIWEARQLLEAANKYKVATQMGNQGYSNEGTRQAAEMIWAGEIGNVTEVHAWTDRPIWPQGLTAIPPLGTGPRHARLGPLARHRRKTAIHLRWSGLQVAPRWALLSARQLARFLRFRLWRAGRYGLPHSGSAEPGAATGCSRPVWNAFNRKARATSCFRRNR